MVAGRKKECIKVESTILAEQREQYIMKRKGKQTQNLNFLSVFSRSSNVFVRWLRLHRFTSGVSPLSEAHPEIGADIFDCVYIFVAGVQLASVPLPVWQRTPFKPASSSYFRLVSEGEPYPFPVVPHLLRRLETSGFF